VPGSGGIASALPGVTPAALLAEVANLSSWLAMVIYMKTDPLGACPSNRCL
jgi:hypothetical protein